MNLDNLIAFYFAAKMKFLVFLQKTELRYKFGNILNFLKILKKTKIIKKRKIIFIESNGT